MESPTKIREAKNPVGFPPAEVGPICRSRRQDRVGELIDLSEHFATGVQQNAAKDTVACLDLIDKMRHI